jgi:hypothetical protein
LAQVIERGKYETGQPATWGDGDWNGGGAIDADHLPVGDGRFDREDILAAAYVANYHVALDFGVTCDAIQVRYDRLDSGGRQHDGRASILYDAATGEISWESPAGVDLGSVYLASDNGIFTRQTSQGLDGDFDIATNQVLFKAQFGRPFGALSLGPVARAGLPEKFVLADLTATGTLAGGGWAVPNLIYARRIHWESFIGRWALRPEGHRRGDVEWPFLLLGQPTLRRGGPPRAGISRDSGQCKFVCRPDARWRPGR